MVNLEQNIRQAIASDEWAATSHADERLAERKVEAWQVAAASLTGVTMLVDPNALPNPKILIKGMLPDGTEVVIAWAWIESTRQAAVITVNFERV